MEKDFEKIELEILKGLREHSSSVAFFTGDNSFPQFIRNFANEILINLKEAMADKELTEIKNLKDSFRRFFNVLYSSAEIRLLDYNLIEFFTNYLLLVNNFISMIQQGNLFSFYKLDEKEVEEFAGLIPEIEDIIKLNLNTENLVNLTNDLIKKAKQVLAAAPSNFKISDHFFKALKRDNNDTCK